MLPITKSLNIIDLLDGYFFTSKSEARRAIKQGAKIRIRYFFNGMEGTPTDIYIKTDKDMVDLYGVDTFLVGSSDYKYKRIDSYVKHS